MKQISTLIVAIGLFLFTLNAQAQTNSKDQFTYNYGIMTGYEFEDSKIPYRRMPMQSIIKGIKDHLNGSSNMTEADAEKVVQTMGDKIEASKTTSGYNYDNFDFSSIGYAYGVLIGSNWKTYGVSTSEGNLNAFLEGIKAVFYDRGQVASREEAQAIVMQKYKEMQGDKSAIKTRENRAFMERNRTNPKVRVLDNGVQYEILRDIEGAPIGATDQRLKIQYIGKLTDGTVFEDYASEPIVVTQSSVRPGMRSALMVMRENQTIKAYIPPSLGYGNQKNGDVPANSILIYEITLLEVLD
jgi:FKBP-type peptidyl-prolyl cis-trans isomerase